MSIYPAPPIPDEGVQDEPDLATVTDLVEKISTTSSETTENSSENSFLIKDDENSIQTESISNCTTSATTLSTSNHNNNVLERNKPPNIEVQEHGSRGSSTNSKSPVSPHLQKREFKLPGTKPENLRILNGSSNGKDGESYLTGNSLGTLRGSIPQLLAIERTNYENRISSLGYY